jgi:hypothetical protein
MQNGIMQNGGGNCSLCGSSNTTKASCPLNPDAKNTNAIKHPKAVAKQSIVKTPTPKLQKVSNETDKVAKKLSKKGTKTRKLKFVGRVPDVKPAIVETPSPKLQKVSNDTDKVSNDTDKVAKKLSKKGTKTRKLKVVGRVPDAKQKSADKPDVIVRPITVVPGAKPLSKERKRLLNKNPPLKEAYISFLDKYGIKFGTNPLGSGTFSDVYDLGNDTVLRIEPSTYFNRYADAHERVNKYLIDNSYFITTLYDIFPRIYSVDVKKSLLSSTTGWVIAVVMEKLDIDNWTNWRNYFATPEKLIKSAKEATEMMHKSGLIHTDISVNNVLLTKAGRIVFIDVDDSCLIPGCDSSPGRTPGYEAPEWALGGHADIKGKARAAMKETIAEWGIDPKTLPKETDFKRGHYDEPLKKNTIYGMGALLYHILTGNDPANKIKLSDVHPDIKNMLHPDMYQRSL